MGYACACGRQAVGRCLGVPLCKQCWEDEDDAVEACERREAKARGYQYGWKEEPAAKEA